MTCNGEPMLMSAMPEEPVAEAPKKREVEKRKLKKL